jgi:hypothetical protein
MRISKQITSIDTRLLDSSYYLRGLGGNKTIFSA